MFGLETKGAGPRDHERVPAAVTTTPASSVFITVCDKQAQHLVLRLVDGVGGEFPVRRASCDHATHTHTHFNHALFTDAALNGGYGGGGGHFDL